MDCKVKLHCTIEAAKEEMLHSEDFRSRMASRQVMLELSRPYEQCPSHFMNNSLDLAVGYVLDVRREHDDSLTAVVKFIKEREADALGTSNSFSDITITPVAKVADDHFSIIRFQIHS